MYRKALDFVVTGAVVICGLIVVGSVVAYPGDPDLSFGVDGRVTTDFAGHIDAAEAVVIDSEDRIIVAGRVGNALDFDLGLARYLDDGSLDPSFGTGGKVIVDLDSQEELFDVTLDSQGRIIAAGFAQIGSENQILIARFNPNDGSLDLSFNTVGYVTVDVGGSAQANAVAVDYQDRIIVAGEAANVASTVSASVLVRLTSAGVLDPTFDGDGVVISTFGSTFSMLSDMQVSGGDEATLQILVSGVREYDLGQFELVVARYLTNGMLDTTFGAGGISLIRGGATSISDVKGLGVFPITRDIILVGSTQTPGPDWNIFVITLDTNGNFLNLKVIPRMPDNQFGTGVITTVDGAFIGGLGETGTPSISDFIVYSVRSDGSVDLNFGPNGDGSVVTDFGGGVNTGDYLRDLALDRSGRIVAVGGVEVGTSENPGIDFGVARYEANTLVINGFMTEANANRPTVPQGWKVSKIQSNDGRRCDNASSEPKSRSAPCHFRFKAESNILSALLQNISQINASPGDFVTVNVFAENAVNAPTGKRGIINVRLTIRYTDGRVEKLLRQTNEIGTGYRNIGFISFLTGVPSSITIRVEAKGTGVVRFDDFSLRFTRTVIDLNNAQLPMLMPPSFVPEVPLEPLRGSH